MVQNALPGEEAALPWGHAAQALAPALLYLPSGHSAGEEEESPEKDPAGASVQLEEPASEEAKVPGAQGRQAVALTAPGEEEAVPGGQEEQALREAEPSSSLKVPAGQGLQAMAGDEAPLALPKVPRGQRPRQAMEPKVPVKEPRAHF